MKVKGLMVESLFQNIRYEYGSWPLWREDKNLRYQLKSLLHRRRSFSPNEQQHFAQAANYLSSKSWTKHTVEGKQLTLACVGDLMWFRNISADYLSPDVTEYLNRHDLCCVNLESPVDRSQSVPRITYDKFNAPVDLLAPWNAIQGMKVFSLCNNHALDVGIAGFSATRGEVLGLKNTHCVGGVDRNEAVCIVDIDGIRIGCLGATYAVNTLHKKNSIVSPGGLPIIQFGNPSVPPDWDKISSLIAECRTGGAQVIIAFLHWGFEFEYWPDPLQRQHAYRLIELGVDVILGSSPHLLQPIEIVSVDGWDATCPLQVRRGAMPRPGLILYSLGNFASAMPTRACKTGAILSIRLCVGHTGMLSLDTLSLFLTESARCKINGHRSRRVVSKALMKEGASNRFEGHIRKIFQPIMVDA